MASLGGNSPEDHAENWRAGLPLTALPAAGGVARVAGVKRLLCVFGVAALMVILT
jgi:hypothetical protein